MLSPYRASPDYASVQSFASVAQRLLAAAPADPTQSRLPARTPVLAQLREGSCASTATCDGYAQIMPSPVPLSIQFNYWCARRARREESTDSGADLVGTFTAGRTIGFCEDALWPYDTTRVLERPPLAAFERAYDNRFANAYAIHAIGPSQRTEILAAHHAGVPIVVGGPILLSAWQSYRAGDVLRAPQTTDTGHAFLLVGYRVMPDGRFQWLLKNSWSSEWGDGGYAWIEEEYIADPLMFFELMVPIPFSLAPRLTP